MSESESNLRGRSSSQHPPKVHPSPKKASGKKIWTFKLGVWATILITEGGLGVVLDAPIRVCHLHNILLKTI